MNIFWSMHNEVFNLTKPSLMILYQESSVHKTVTTSPSITYHQPLSDFSFAKTRLLRHNLQRQRVQLMTNWGPSSDDKRVYASSLVPCNFFNDHQSVTPLNGESLRAVESLRDFFFFRAVLLN